MFCKCGCSVLPYNVLHFTSLKKWNPLSTAVCVTLQNVNTRAHTHTKKKEYNYVVRLVYHILIFMCTAFWFTLSKVNTIAIKKKKDLLY